MAVAALAGGGGTARTGAADATGWWLVATAIVLLAFNDLPTLLPLGELSQDAFLYAVPLLALHLLRTRGGIPLPPLLLAFGLAFALVVVAGVALNLGGIAAAAFKGRTGFGRVLTQGLTFGLGLLIALLFHALARQGMLPAMVRGARIALGVMAVVGVLELASWRGVPGLTQLHAALAGFLHANSGAEYVERLRSTAFEVSWTGAMLAFFFPFAAIAWDGRLRPVLAATAVVLAITLLSQSRTGLLVVGLQLLLLLWFHLRRRLDLLVHAALAACLAIGLTLAVHGSLAGRVAEAASNLVRYGSFDPAAEQAEGNVSNVSRAAALRAGLGMFADRPLLGVGFGQFGFHYPAHVGSADLRSYEVRNWVTDAQPGWPPGFSVHTRLLAETGLAGYLLWLGFVLALLLRSLRAALDDGLGRAAQGAHLAVAMTLLGVLMVGLSTDSFRFFGGWIAIGVALALPGRAAGRGGRGHLFPPAPPHHRLPAPSSGGPG